MKAWACALCEATTAGTAVKRSRAKRDLCQWCVDDLAARGLAWCAAGQHKANATDMERRGARGEWCGECRRQARRGKNAEAARRWRERYPERYRASYLNENTRAANRERNRRYYWRNPEHHRALARGYYRRHRDKRAPAYAAYRAANRERLAAAARLLRLRRKLQILRGWHRAA